MVKRIVLNNLIAVAIQMVINTLSFVMGFTLFIITVPLLWRLGDPIVPRVPALIYMSVLVFSVTAVYIFLHYCGGRFILRTTGNIWTNLLSVAAPTVVAFAVVLLTLIDGRTSNFAVGFALLANMPLIPVTLVLLIPEGLRGFPDILANILINVIFPLLPSLALWLGLITKKKPKIAAEENHTGF